MFRILNTALKAAFILISMGALSLNADAGPRDLDCRCDYQCTYSDNSKSNHGWTYDKRPGGNDFTRQVNTAERNDCRSYCNAFANRVKTDALNIAESKGACGNISCTGTKALKREPDTNKPGQTEWWEPASPINAEYSGAQCAPGSGIDGACCGPVSSNRLRTLFHQVFTGPTGDVQRLQYVQDPNLDAILQAQIELVNLLYPSNNMLNVEYSLYDSTITSSPTLLGSQTVTYTANGPQSTPSIFFTNAIQNGRRYSIKVAYSFNGGLDYFHEDCEDKAISYQFIATDGMRVARRELVAIMPDGSEAEVPVFTPTLKDERINGRRVIEQRPVLQTRPVERR